jgi:hypothetical protein
MARLEPGEQTLGVLIALIVGVICLFIAWIVSQSPNLVALGATVGIIVFVVAFLYPEAGLYILLLSMLLSPEIIVGSLGAGASASRGVTLRLDDFLLLLLAATWLARGAIHKELGVFLSSPLNRPIAVYLAITAVATMVGMLFDRVRPLLGTLYVLKYAEYFIVYFATLNYITTKKQIRRLTTVAIITALVVALFAIAQIPRGIRVSAPFEGEAGEPNTLGGYLILLASILAGLMLTAPSLRQGMRYVAGIILLGVPFIFTLSRASYLAALAVAPVLIYYSRRKLIAGFAIVTIFLIMVIIAPASVTERIRYTFGGQGVRSDQVVIGSVRLDTSTSARLASYQEVLRDFPHEPVIGYGVTGYSFVDGQYMRVLIETGLVGLAAFLWLLGALIRQGLATLRSASDGWERGLAIGYLAGLAGLILHAIGSNTFIIVRIMEPFWFFTGVVTLLHMHNSGILCLSGDEDSPAEIHEGFWQGPSSIARYTPRSNRFHR